MDWVWTRNKLANITTLVVMGQRAADDLNRANLATCLHEIERQVADIRAQIGYYEPRKERVR